MIDNVQIPDVTGFRLEQALKLLKRPGTGKISVKLTAAPRLRDAGYDGNSRVVRVTVSADKSVELLVCNVD